MTKYEKAFKAEYNRQYALAVAELGADGIDTGILVACHAQAAYKTDLAVGLCKCNGNGSFAVRNEPDANGKTWHYEVCFGCAGKGFQSPADQKRNWGYWAFYARIEA